MKRVVRIECQRKRSDGRALLQRQRRIVPPTRNNFMEPFLEEHRLPGRGESSSDCANDDCRCKRYSIVQVLKVAK